MWRDLYTLVWNSSNEQRISAKRPIKICVWRKSDTSRTTSDMSGSPTIFWLACKYIWAGLPSSSWLPKVTHLMHIITYYRQWMNLRSWPSRTTQHHRSSRMDWKTRHSSSGQPGASDHGAITTNRRALSKQEIRSGTNCDEGRNYTKSSSDNKYAVDDIVRHIGSGPRLRYVVRWNGYSKAEETLGPLSTSLNTSSRCTGDSSTNGEGSNYNGSSPKNDLQHTPPSSHIIMVYNTQTASTVKSGQTGKAPAVLMQLSC